MVSVEVFVVENEQIPFHQTPKQAVFGTQSLRNLEKERYC